MRTDYEHVREIVIDGRYDYEWDDTLLLLSDEEYCGYGDWWNATHRHHALHLIHNVTSQYEGIGSGVFDAKTEKNSLAQDCIDNNYPVPDKPQ